MRVTYELVKELFDYNPETGELTPKKKMPGPRISSGGYLRISCFGTQFLVHLVIWLWMTGELPKNGLQVDHEDRDKLNNRWDNLRLRTCEKNNQNKIEANTNNKLGVRGISKVGEHFRVRVFANGKQYNVGYFDTLEEAVTARQLHVKRFHA